MNEREEREEWSEWGGIETHGTLGRRRRINRTFCCSDGLWFLTVAINLIQSSTLSQFSFAYFPHSFALSTGGVRARDVISLSITRWTTFRRTSLLPPHLLPILVQVTSLAQLSITVLFFLLSSIKYSFSWHSFSDELAEWDLRKKLNRMRSSSFPFVPSLPFPSRILELLSDLISLFTLTVYELQEKEMKLFSHRWVSYLLLVLIGSGSSSAFDSFDSSCPCEKGEKGDQGERGPPGEKVSGSVVRFYLFILLIIK